MGFCLPIQAQLLSLLVEIFHFLLKCLSLQLYFNTNAVCVQDEGHAHAI